MRDKTILFVTVFVYRNVLATHSASTLPKDRTMKVRHTALTLLAASLAIFGSQGALAQGTPAVEPTRSEHGDWVTLCIDQPTKRCQVLQTIDVENEQGQGRLLETAVQLADDGNLIIQWLLPLGVDLRPGIVVKVDEQPEFNASYLTCVQNGCVVVAPMDAARLAQFRAGTTAKLGFRSINNAQNLAIDISLKGFTAATRGAGFP